ncbi:hypothetical protein [Streptomyces boninensis]|uniref:hypothetical protein n=1 Tax=Streptomyces boninensis TaxID=2039455 RepID=UPI003B2236AA
MSTGPRLRFADAREAAGVAAFLGRLLRYDRAAAVRLQGAGGALAVFGKAPALDVVVVRTASADVASASGSASGSGDSLDSTVSAGQLADAIDGGTPAADGGLDVPVPDAVTGPPWAGLLPPRTGWQPLPGLPEPDDLRGAVAAGVKEFKARVEALPEDKRTRSELDRIGAEIWGRRLGGTELPLRAAHAAHVFGLLRGPATLVAAGNWLRLRTPYGSIALRRGGGLPGLGVTPR